ncbi:MAG: type IV pilin protein, partial [Gammaproteobacteria bacterium]|nr:type IV pilin protein [Gammaproteobacteria bacterium]
VGILAVIANGWYQSFVREANRADAQTALLALANAQEKSFIANNGYTDLTASIPAMITVTSTAGQGIIYQVGTQFFSPGGHYTLALTNDGNANTHTVTATAASASQLADTGCTAITINETNQRSPERCWR